MGKAEPCPYRDICPKCCPGDDKDDGPWLPVDGFRLVEEGLLCIDWNIILSQSKELLPEGTHLMGTLDGADRLELPKGPEDQARKTAQKKYEQSEKGRLTRARSNRSTGAQLSRQKYYYSEKGQAKFGEVRQTQSFYRKVAKWLKQPENIGKTMEDYIKEVGTTEET